ncbi:MAG: hypothetical protein KIT09_08720 [Bryobacteraceae bacterium]|nr:hypothetical protein [Bryobacteraceae bacterium]
MGIRYRCLAGLLAALSLTWAAEPRKTRNVILVTADGLRWQELFTGIEPLLMNEKQAGMGEAQERRTRLWRATPEERREALLPFFWTTLARRGVVLGNRNKNSPVKVSNAYRVSYPGYSEILTGRAQDATIRGNDRIQNPSPTVLEFLREKFRLAPAQVALFASWDMFPYIGQHRPGSIFVNAGYSEATPAESGPRFRELNRLQVRMLTPWDSVRHDYITFELALEYMRTAHPRVVHIALGETDDWAHDGRYDRVLDLIGYFDACLRRLWRAVESLEFYRDATSIVVTVDHGRGVLLSDWQSHGSKVAGAEQIWIAIAGPDTPPQGELSNTPEYLQRDIAPTMLDLLGIDYREYKGALGKPIPQATGRKK